MTDRHRNDERTVRCPVEGCDATPLARGINLHIMRSSGNGHGPRGDVPDHISLKDLETVGERTVEMDYPEERDTDDAARLCPYCNQTFAGLSGLKIHLGQTAGRDNHPESPKDLHEPGDFPRIEADAEGNVTKIVESPSDESLEKSDKVAVPAARVFRLIASLLAEDKPDVAQRVRLELLRPLIEADQPSFDHADLFEALLAQGRTDGTPDRITAAMEREGIMVACRGESALMDTAEARELARQLEHVATNEAWDDEETEEFIMFLRYVSDVLDGNPRPFKLHTEFGRWRED